MVAMLLRLFFEYFGDTSLIAEKGVERIGFLVGFLPPASSADAYIHFVSVHPVHRQSGIGRRLSETFFDIARRANRSRVCCVTSAVNQHSIAFHRAMGFAMKPSETTVNGLPYLRDYDGTGEDRVVFVKPLDPLVVSTSESRECP